MFSKLFLATLALSLAVMTFGTPVYAGCASISLDNCASTAADARHQVDLLRAKAESAGRTNVEQSAELAMAALSLLEDGFRSGSQSQWESAYKSSKAQLERLSNALESDTGFLHQSGVKSLWDAIANAWNDIG